MSSEAESADRDALNLAVEVHGLRVEAPSGDPIVEDMSFNLAAGEALGLVGESGSGKTTAVLSLLGYTQAGASITSGEVFIGGQVVAAGNDTAARRLRGRYISYVPQNPGGALNPSMRVGDAVLDMLRAHRTQGKPPPVAGAALERAGLPGDHDFQRRYPHQLSGGQQQRVCIAVALVCEPPVVVLDEPTTGLDVVTQALILEELLRLRTEQGMAMLYVTHDLAVVAGFADRLAVMYAGRIIEHGPTAQVLRHPRHPYTRGLLTSIPDHVRPRVLEPLRGVAVGVGERNAGCAFAPRCDLRVGACDESMPPLRSVGPDHESRCLRTDEVTDPAPVMLTPARREAQSSIPVLGVVGLRAEHRGRRRTLVAAQDVNFTIARGQCVALVGESGSGKTTIARTIAGLHPIAAGQITLDGERLASTARERTREQRQRVQIIFQNPSDALNPKQTIKTILARPARMLRGLSSKGLAEETNRLLDLVRLPRGLGDRYPAELSGGERQRIGIARALAAEPDVVICDEITSALDVSVQAAVLSLLRQLREELGLALLFITHDLGVVATIADDVLVLERSRVVESGLAASVLTSPQHPYTIALLGAAPSISEALAGSPSAALGA
jgi:peptide/nickel transport system ATP-binding protein